MWKTTYLLIFVIIISILTSHAAIKQDADNNIGKFEENIGQIFTTQNQVAKNVLFHTTSDIGDIYITTTGISWVFRKSTKESEKQFIQHKKYQEKSEHVYQWNRIDMDLLNANIDPAKIYKEGQSVDYTNYYLAHCSKGINYVRTFDKITIPNVYPGIDWVIYSKTNGNIKHEFVIHQGSDPDQIKWKYRGAEDVQVKQDGSMEIKGILGKLSEAKPISYQEATMDIQTEYHSKNGVWQYKVDNYDFNKPLTIDPDLIWGTYYGGTGNDGFTDMVIHPIDQSVLIAGYSSSTDFPVDSTNGVWLNNGYGDGEYDVLILRFDNSGIRKWATFFGGSGTERGYAISALTNNNIIISGFTSSTDLPTIFKAGAYNDNTLSDSNDVFLLELSESGTALWATYFGGNEYEECFSISPKSDGGFYITGHTASTAGFPLLDRGAGAHFQGILPADSISAYIAEFDQNRQQVWCTYYGGNKSDYGNSLAVDKVGNVFLAGRTSSANFPLKQNITEFYQPYTGSDFQNFVVQFNNNGQLLWGTTYGDIGVDRGSAVTVDNDDNFYVAGNSSSNAVMLIKFNKNRNLLWSNNIGPGNSINQAYDIPRHLACDNRDNIYITGQTYNHIFPKTQLYGSWIQAGNHTLENSFLGAYTPSGEQFWSSPFGTLTYDFGTAVAVDASNNIFFIGEWKGPQSLATKDPENGAWFVDREIAPDDSYIVKFTPICPELISSSLTDTVCLGDTVMLYTIYSDSTIWNTGSMEDSITISINNDTLIIADMNNIECSIKDSVYLYVYQFASSISKDTTICVGDTTYLHVNGGDVVRWMNGNPNRTINAYPQQTITFSVTIQDTSYGCEEQLEVTVFISEDDSCTIYNDFFIPNVYSVSSQNNGFKPILSGEYTSYEFMIYDRYGNQAFYSTDPNERWNGIYGKKTANYGVYTYRLVLDGEEISTGNITILK